jgi:hypothetical protein
MHFHFSRNKGEDINKNNLKPCWIRFLTLKSTYGCYQSHLVFIILIEPHKNESPWSYWLTLSPGQEWYICEESSLCFFFAVHLASWLRGTKPVTLWTQFKTNSIQENGGQQYRGQQKYVSGIKQTHNGGGLERPVMEKKRSMIAFHEGNWLWIPQKKLLILAQN